MSNKVGIFPGYVPAYLFHPRKCAPCRSTDPERQCFVELSRARAVELSRACWGDHRFFCSFFLCKSLAKPEGACRCIDVGCSQTTWLTWLHESLLGTFTCTCNSRDWLFGPRDGRSNRPRDKIHASASLRARQRRWFVWSNLYHFNHDSAERSKSKLWRFFGFGFAKKSSCCLSWLFLDLIRSWASHGQWWFWALSLSYLGATVRERQEARSDQNSRPLSRYEQDHEAFAKWGEQDFSLHTHARTHTTTHIWRMSFWRT